MALAAAGAFVGGVLDGLRGKSESTSTADIEVVNTAMTKVVQQQTTVVNQSSKARGTMVVNWVFVGSSYSGDEANIKNKTIARATVDNFISGEQSADLVNEIMTTLDQKAKSKAKGDTTGILTTAIANSNTWARVKNDVRTFVTQVTNTFVNNLTSAQSNFQWNFNLTDSIFDVKTLNVDNITESDLLTSQWITTMQKSKQLNDFKEDIKQAPESESTTGSGSGEIIGIIGGIIGAVLLLIVVFGGVGLIVYFVRSRKKAKALANTATSTATTLAGAAASSFKAPA